MSTIYILRALTDPAREWIEEKIQYDEYQKLGVAAVAVEHGFIASIMSGLVEAGFEQGKDFEVLPG